MLPLPPVQALLSSIPTTSNSCTRASDTNSHFYPNQHRHYSEFSHQIIEYSSWSSEFKGHATGNFSAEILLHIAWRIHPSNHRRKRACLSKWPLELSRCFLFQSGVDFLSGRYLGPRHHNVSLLARSVILRLLSNKKHLKNVVQSGANGQDRGGKDSNRIPRHTKKCAKRVVNIAKNYGLPTNRPERNIHCATGSFVSLPMEPKWFGRLTSQSLQQKESNMTVPRAIGHTIMESSCGTYDQTQYP